MAGGRMRKRIKRLLLQRRFRGSADYWEARYRAGLTSGSGSYGRLARYKAGFLDALVAEHDVHDVVELGCGDGHQLGLAHYPRYTGLDVSETAVARCRDAFGDREGFRFFVEGSPDAESLGRDFDLALSLDVVYHLVEDPVYDAYLVRLFGLSRRLVVIYASDEDRPEPVKHVRHRRFTADVAARFPEWTLIHHEPNRFPYERSRPDDTSFAEFHVYARADR